MKRSLIIIALALCLALLAACAVAEAATQLFQLGTSAYTIEIDADFVVYLITERNIVNIMY